MRHVTGREFSLHCVFYVSHLGRTVDAWVLDNLGERVILEVDLS
jgi:hypothetical protein